MLFLSLCLPLHGRLTDADLQTILERIHDAYTASAPVRTVVEPASAAL